MRVAQIIDSLEAGGAERMAVNYANSLSGKIDFSGLISTRKEGVLKEKLYKEVPYFFLKRNKTIDIPAIFRLRKYLKTNQIDILHTHGSSFFIAVFVKLTMPAIKIIWHDHYGTRIKETKKQNRVLISLSVFFSSIFVVNPKLEEWSRKNMKCSSVTFIPNFANVDIYEKTTELKGDAGKRIVFLANLKNPKNHILILKAFQDLRLNDLGWSLHLIGKDYFDDYSNTIKNFINTYSLEHSVYLYGVRNDIGYILSQASIGILSSTEEGFPVALLEYGEKELAVVSTSAGYCSKIIEHGFNGLLFDPFSNSQVKLQLSALINNESYRRDLGKNLKETILKNYAAEIVINKITSEYKKIKK
ncbi:glycosyltransferase [Flavobacterium foetidum]|uniref:glycosyltransferase n=1 Tax=Flavobacterium foetidum TaxID=2026681 RepID=UPI0010752656|nr:glycosyltransferase [Flavobacterium foetidum]KAF2513574.1 glycosyltransferase [Flavobacterium foetidum]